MIKIDQKNKMAVDIALHIPLPSFNIKIVRTDEEDVLNEPLQYNQSTLRSRQTDQALKSSKGLNQPGAQNRSRNPMKTQDKADGKGSNGKEE